MKLLLLFILCFFWSCSNSVVEFADDDAFGEEVNIVEKNNAEIETENISSSSSSEKTETETWSSESDAKDLDSSLAENIVKKNNTEIETESFSSSSSSEKTETETWSSESDAEDLDSSLTEEVNVDLAEQDDVVSLTDDLERDDVIPKLFISYDSALSSEYTTAYFKFIDAKRHYSSFSSTEDFEEYGYIKVRGNSTAKAPKKPYNIKFEKKKSFLGMGKAKKWALLSNPFDPTLVRNKLIYDMASQLYFDYSPKSYFADVWVNGEFMGNYQIVEKVEFQENRIPYKIENGDYLIEPVGNTKRNKAGVTYVYSPVFSLRLALDEPENPSQAQMDRFLTDLEKIESAIASHDIMEYVKFVDLRSIIDHYWVEEFVNNTDWPNGSFYYTIHNGILRGGPVWDFDLALGNTRASENASTMDFHLRKIWWEYLFQDSVFKKIAYERYLQIFPYFDNLVNDNELGANKLDSLLDFFRESFERNYSDSGWAYCGANNLTVDSSMRQLTCPYNPVPRPTFDENVLFLRKWVSQRNLNLIGQVSRELNELANVEMSLDEILAIQDSIFAH